MPDLAPAADLAEANAVRHPNESAAYRRARQELLVHEIELRRQTERVAELRRALPLGGAVPADYRFVAEDGTQVTLSDLFGDHDTLAIYSYMFGPEREAPCPMCTSFMGSFERKIPDIAQRLALAFVARAPIERLAEAKAARGWVDLPIYQDAAGSFHHDYVSVDDDDAPAFNVFTRVDGEVHHFWSEEMGPELADPGQDPRAAIEMDALWLLLDATPEGRRTEWYPRLTY